MASSRQLQSELTADSIHLWRTHLMLAPAGVEYCAAMLAADEMARAARFRFERDRRRFVVAHGVLRLILAHYLHEKPERLCFGYGANGKPYLQPRFYIEGEDGGTTVDYEAGDRAAVTTLQFNVAHSQEMAVYAVTREREVGVDLEYLRELSDTSSIARRFFCQGEYEELMALPESQRHGAFYRCWTRKEAFIKLLGTGLSHPLDAFQVTLLPGMPARLVWVKDVPDGPTRWRMAELPDLHGLEYAGAVVVEGDISCLQSWSVDELWPHFDTLA